MKCIYNGVYIVQEYIYDDMLEYTYNKVYTW